MCLYVCLTLLLAEMAEWYLIKFGTDSLYHGLMDIGYFTRIITAQVKPRHS